MPFVETYSVKFWNGNLNPHVNLRNWPAITLSPSTADNLAEWFPDASGMTFRITRGPTPDPDKGASNSAYVVPTDGIPLNSRVMMRAIFDLPLAEGFSEDGQLHPIPPFSSGEIHPPLRKELEQPGRSPVGAEVGPLSEPEPWAVGLNLGSSDNFPGEATVPITCQFNRRWPTGVRVNTPGSLQDDQAAYLESPLNYKQYQGGPLAPHDDRWVSPPVFTLEHSFCGWKTDENRHTPGCGFLMIYRTWLPEVRDHRVFSSDALITASGPTLSSIDALGVTLGTDRGIGRLTVRLRSFSIWLNEPIP